MTSELLEKARKYEESCLEYIDDKDRPAYHLTGGVGWINDPNGFSLYKGEYHLFFQYHPYSIKWGPMHWGHVKTEDFVRWERLPIAMAPDSPFDGKGCFSGSAVEMPDGRQMLMYTGVTEVASGGNINLQIQQQCVAFGDGIEYTKYAGNPVITSDDLPSDGMVTDFRDPKVWKEGDTYYCAVSNNSSEDSGVILLYESRDGIHWKYVTVLEANRGQYGRMWECPDFFELDGKHVLIVSPMKMRPAGLEFHAGYGTIALIGGYDPETHKFIRENVQSVDYGIDFYAAQTLEAKDGRRIMIAWMQNWTTIQCEFEDHFYFGQMTLPRELWIENGRMYQRPVRELEHYRSAGTVYRNIFVHEEMSLPQVRGRCLDMTVRVKPVSGKKYSWFRINFADDGEYYTSIIYDASSNHVRLDRSRCGFPYDIVNVREFPVSCCDGEIELRILLDRYSVELFVNGGEQAATMLVYTDPSADSVTFAADSEVLIDIEKFDLEFEWMK